MLPKVRCRSNGWEGGGGVGGEPCPLHVVLTRYLSLERFVPDLSAGCMEKVLFLFPRKDAQGDCFQPTAHNALLPLLLLLLGLRLWVSRAPLAAAAAALSHRCAERVAVRIGRCAAERGSGGDGPSLQQPCGCSPLAARSPRLLPPLLSLPSGRSRRCQPVNRGRASGVVSPDRDTWQRSGALCNGLIGTEERKEVKRKKKK